MRQPSRSKQEEHKYYNTRKWKDLRKQKLQENPLCELCLEKGIVEAATEVHHITPFMQFYGYERFKAAYPETNKLMALCENCHLDIHKKHKIKRDSSKFIEKLKVNGKSELEQTDKTEDESGDEFA